MKNLLLSAAILASIAGVSGEVSAKVTYPEDTEGTTAIIEPSITFEKADGPIDPVDPENPDGVLPGLPGNPNVGEFGILYVSDFNFGTQEKSGSSWNALADIREGEGVGEGTLTPSIQTVDFRDSTDREGWVLTATLGGPFKDAKGDVLKGAELTLSNMKYNRKDDVPTLTQTPVLLSEDGAVISEADETTGYGLWPISLGKLSTPEEDEGTKGLTTNGITLTVPATSPKNTAKYSTTVTYELSQDPTV